MQAYIKIEIKVENMACGFKYIMYVGIILQLTAGSPTLADSK